MRIAVLILALLWLPLSAAAQTEAVFTRAPCGNAEVLLTLRDLNRPTTEDGVVLSSSRINANLDDLLGRSLAITITDGGEPVACGPLPSSPEEPGRVEFDLGPVGGAGVVGYAILREFTPGVTTALVTVARFEVTAVSSITDADRAYIAYLTGAINTMTESTARFADLASNPQIGDTDWTIGISAELGIWRSEYVSAQEVTAPRRIADAHATWLEVLALMDGASRDVARGLDTFDVASINEGTQKIRQATSLMEEVNQLLVDLAAAVSE